jgi:hypothetical protein
VSIEFIFELGAAIVICAGITLRLLRVDHGTLFPAGAAPLLVLRDREAAYSLASNPALLELAAAHDRLRILMPAGPAGQDVLWSFGHEVCAILQTVERSLIQVSSPSPLLDWLLIEVQAVEKALGAHKLQPYSEYELRSEQAYLAGRLTTIRMCARDLIGPAAWRIAKRNM